ncbi:uncharacterized protein C19orf44 homolog isoform X2 [Girardinichthys multiradiatus]|uniref:uncharacterized protein C19orf44 homolog isoform X2 n=1 Tax=Girardinichthys multiradiatus TaxID=208333 RepID=UPI001FAE6DF8|nr:uncharacterized protein C19orf44 homolog isoform X2 [Girardinichthys multiradiatus]
MWKVSGRSSALDRAQALLSAKRSSGGDGGGSTRDSPTKTQGGSFRTRSVPPNSHTFFPDLSDLSSESSASEHGAEATGPANTQEDPERKGDSSKDLKPQSSVGEGSRFLKKAPKPANSSHSPVSRNRAQRGSQAPVLRRLAEIESHVRSRKQVLEQAKQATAAALQNTEASVELSAQADSDQSQKKNHFLKQKTAGAVQRTNTASPDAANPADVGVRSRSRASDPVVHSGGLERKPRRVMSGISLESDEEDMKKLIGDSVESLSMLGSVKMPHRTLSSHSPSPPAAACSSSPSNVAPPRSPASPSRRSSPFRFTGQAHAQFSPSVLSPSPSPPHAHPSHPDRLGSSQNPDTLQRRSHSSSSSRDEVLSLEDVIPVKPASEDPHSHMSSVSSEDFKINVMTLDELIPASTGTASETPGRQNENKLVDPVPGSQSRHQRSPQEEMQEVVPDYHSDFDSDSSARQISEHLGHDDEDEAEVRSEVRQVSWTDESHKNTNDDYSSIFSEPSCFSVRRTSNLGQRSESLSKSRTSMTRSSWSSSQYLRRRASTRRNFKEAAVQTQPDPLADSWSAGVAPLDSTVSRMYMRPTAVVPHTDSAERLEAISRFDPAAFALNEMLKQQLTMTKQFMDRSEHLHSCLLRSLGPPNYRYTTLEETIQNICKHKHSKPTKEKA